MVIAGDDYAQKGKHIEALVSLMQAYACKADAGTAYKAAVAACNATDADHALQFYKLAADGVQAAIAAVCEQNDIDLPALVDATSTSCNPWCRPRRSTSWSCC